MHVGPKERKKNEFNSAADLFEFLPSEERSSDDL
jgi:hypothetical protein